MAQGMRTISPRRFRSAAIPAESFESFLAGVLVQEAFAFLRIHLGRVELLAGFAQLHQPFFVFRAELIFELFSEALSEGRAKPSRGDGDLECPALNNRGIVEIA